jgi:hypothetical protein
MDRIDQEIRLRETIRAARLSKDINKEIEASKLLKEFLSLPDAAGAQRKLAESKTGIEAATIGAGRSLSQLWEGGKQLLGMGRPEEEAAAEAAAYAPLQQASPMATALGEAVPYMAAGGLAGGGRSLLGGLARQAGASAAVGGAMEGDLAERAGRAAVEGATGAVGEAVARPLARAFGLGLRQAPAEIQEGIARARDLGYRVLPTTGLESPRLRQVFQGGLESTPGGAAQFDAIQAMNQDTLSRAAASSLGETATERVTDRTLASARERISGMFEQVARDIGPVPVDDVLLNDVMRIYGERISPMISGPEDPVRGVIDRTLNYLEKGFDSGMDARELLAQQSKIGKAAKQAFSGANSNPELGHALLDLQDSLLSAIERRAPQGVASSLQEARQQWKHLMLLESGQVIDPVTGKIHAGRLANLLQRRDVKGFTEGGNRSPLYEGVRFMARQQPELPTSGTAERTMVRELLKAGGIGAGLGGAGGAAGDADPLSTAGLGAALAIGGGVLAPNVLARAYLRPGSYDWMRGAAGPGLQDLIRAIAQGGTQTLAQ